MCVYVRVCNVVYGYLVLTHCVCMYVYVYSAIYDHIATCIINGNHKTAVNVFEAVKSTENVQWEFAIASDFASNLQYAFCRQKLTGAADTCAGFRV